MKDKKFHLFWLRGFIVVERLKENKKVFCQILDTPHELDFDKLLFFPQFFCFYLQASLMGERFIK